MQRGVFDLLRAREQHIQTAVAYIDTLRDYWLARADLGLLLSGRVPSTEGSRLSLPQTRGTNGQH
jgi:outer membrane protein, heavy metal efflux system